MRTAYNFALLDWWWAPIPHHIERKDSRLRVEATDNVMVARVQVTVLDDVGNLLERGEAAPATGGIRLPGAGPESNRPVLRLTVERGRVCVGVAETGSS